MSTPTTDSALIIKILEDIQEATKDIPLLEREMKELVEFKNDYKGTIVEVVVNNSELNEKLQSRALTVVENYLNTDAARESLNKRIKDVIDKEILKILIKWLSIQGTILTIVFAGIVGWVFK